MRTLTLLVFVTCFVAVRSAAAEPTPEDVAAAEGHFKQGKAYLEQQLYDDAIMELKAGYALDPLPEFVFNLAQAHRLKGDSAKAIELYQRFIDIDPADPLVDDSRAQIAALTKKIKDKQLADEEAILRRRITEEVEAKKNADAEIYKKQMEQWQGQKTKRHRGLLGLLGGAAALAVGIPLLVTAPPRSFHPDGTITESWRGPVGAGLITGGIGGVVLGGLVFVLTDPGPQPSPPSGVTPILLGSSGAGVAFARYW